MLKGQFTSGRLKSYICSTSERDPKYIKQNLIEQIGDINNSTITKRRE